MRLDRGAFQGQRFGDLGVRETLGDELEAAAAEALAIQRPLDRDDVARDELVAETAQVRALVDVRIDSRADGHPWLIDTTSLAHGLDEANRLIAAY